MHLRIAHLYPKRMSIYGDRGNVVTLAKRCRWRDIAVSVDEVDVEDKLNAERYDLFFFGGGQDQEQDTVAADLATKAVALRDAVGAGSAVLAVCGGYQLLGNYYQPAEGDALKGVGIFDAHTEADPKRLIGNVVAESEIEGIASRPLVGFENHSGLTFLGDDAEPLAKVRKGFGNNGKDGTEGCIAGSAIGTYLHGSLLPKNPQLADWLIKTALKRRYKSVRLSELEDGFELVANERTSERFG
jgi:CobQ-like glutamine amidotransferase family enzyme